jgi:hypothetical protein
MNEAIEFEILQIKNSARDCLVKKKNPRGTEEVFAGSNLSLSVLRK